MSNDICEHPSQKKNAAKIELTTATGQKRSLYTEAIKDESGYIFPPRNIQGHFLPYLLDGELKTPPVEKSDPEWQWWKNEVDSNVFSLFDILMYVGASPDVFKPLGHSIDEWTCQTCPHRQTTQKSSTGSHISCALQRRGGIFPQSLPVCHPQQVEKKRQQTTGIGQPLIQWEIPGPWVWSSLCPPPKKNIILFDSEPSQSQKKREALPEEPAPYKPIKKQRVLPSIRETSKLLFDVSLFDTKNPSVQNMDMDFFDPLCTPNKQKKEQDHPKPQAGTEDKPAPLTLLRTRRLSR